ncbi:MAG: hypothetical protein CMJ64_08970 [Planctomycetaceae bacterium]|nr:hypothetical protein [Planctomycetaceae bacterium]
MAHAAVDNRTPFSFEPLFLSDPDGQPLLVPMVKATYSLMPPSELLFAEEQLPISIEGAYQSDGDPSSYLYEPETAFIKQRTDVSLFGYAFCQNRGDSKVDVTLRVGDAIEKTVRVIGDRVWKRRLGIVDMTNPEPFEKIPLIYERAFGGWDAAEPDPLTSQFEPRNPVGVGFKRKEWEEGMPLPNLEDPKRPLKMYGDTPPPAGFGFISPHWQPRAQYAGTYDEKWEKERAPLLPEDFDLRFFNAASPGLIAPEYLKGNESVLIENASPRGTLSFDLPGVQPPKIRVQLRGREDAHLQTNLDTVIINTDEDLLLMLWRTNLVLRHGPHDVVAIEVTAEGAPLLPKPQV